MEHQPRVEDHHTFTVRSSLRLSMSLYSTPLVTRAIAVHAPMHEALGAFNTLERLSYIIDDFVVVDRPHLQNMFLDKQAA